MERMVAALSLLTALSACYSPPAAGDDPRADPGKPELVKLGEPIYAQHCAVCHGLKLEGQPDWRQRLASGRLPAPPHDESGHTWHHPDRVLFAITRNGLVPPYASKDYESDMPAFGGKLSDEEIWAVLAYIKSHWTSRDVLKIRAEMTRNAGRK
jgi:mono/diheme cytochrome c family protein